MMRIIPEIHAIRAIPVIPAEKKAFLKIIEVFIAITIVFVFIMMTQSKTVVQNDVESRKIMQFLSTDEGFRSDVYSINNYCVKKGSGLRMNQRIESALPKYLNYTLCVYNDPNFKIDGLPDKKVYVDSYYFSADNYSYDGRIAKLFYWN